MDISNLVNNFIANYSSIILTKYVPPTIPTMSHVFEIETSEFLGTISVWASGMVDWNIYDIETSNEAFLGSSIFDSEQQLCLAVEKVLQAMTK